MNHPLLPRASLPSQPGHISSCLGAQLHVKRHPRPQPQAHSSFSAPWGHGTKSQVSPRPPPEHPKPVASPEGDGVVEGADGLDTGHRALRSKARFDEGPWVEHAQKLVDYDLGKELLREQMRTVPPLQVSCSSYVTRRRAGREESCYDFQISSETSLATKQGDKARGCF